MKSTTRRATLTGLATTAILTLAATPALAHVTITPSTTAPGATTVLRVEIPHGCDGSATTAVSVRLPAGLTDVNAAGTDRWAVDISSDAVTFTTDDPLPDAETAVLELNANLPDEAGATLVLPVVQTCEDGEAAWTEVAADGQDPEDLDRPAPVVVVTGATGSGDTGEGAADAGAGDGGAAGEADTGAATGSAPGSEEDAAHAGHAGHGHAGHGAGDVVASDAGTATDADEVVAPLVLVGVISILVVGGVVGRLVLQRRRRAGAA